MIFPDISAFYSDTLMMVLIIRELFCSLLTYFSFGNKLIILVENCILFGRFPRNNGFLHLISLATTLPLQFTFLVYFNATWWFITIIILLLSSVTSLIKQNTQKGWKMYKVFCLYCSNIFTCVHYIKKVNVNEGKIFFIILPFQKG